MVDDVTLNKAGIIERCLRRLDEEYCGHEAELESNFTRQDAIVLNLLRACEGAIGLAMHQVRRHRLGIPQTSAEAFVLLAEANLIDVELAGRMRRMVGFRNIAVHEYRALDLAIVRDIIEHRLDDFRQFASIFVAAASP